MFVYTNLNPLQVNHKITVIKRSGSYGLEVVKKEISLPDVQDGRVKLDLMIDVSDFFVGAK